MAVFSEMVGLDVSPLTNNIICSGLTLVYILVIMEISTLMRDKLKMPEIARKVIHIAAASWLLFWPLFDTSHWSWRLNVAIPFVYVIKLLYLALILKDPNNEDIKNMSRTGDPMELLVGPLQFVIIMLWLGLLEFMTLKAAVVMAAMGIGDGIAPLIGKRWGMHKYQVPCGTPKSVEGSIGGVFLGTIVGLCIYPPLLGFGFFDLRDTIALAVVATIGEGTAPFNSDNIAVPVMMSYTLDYLQGKA